MHTLTIQARKKIAEQKVFCAQCGELFPYIWIINGVNGANRVGFRDF